MPPDPSEELARANRAFIIAAAGCGKTETVARAAGIHSQGRQLVLTHTHAGVRALKDRLAKVHADRRRVHVDTIAGFALRYAASFPIRSGLPSPKPASSEWSATYDAARRVLETSLGRTILSESYSGMFVDEYQDCISSQHLLVMAMADVLPCRVVLDPLQGIFGWAGPLVSYERDLAPTFDRFPDLVMPYRWRATNPSLGEWLLEVRRRLMAGDDIDLSGAPVRRGGVDPQTQVSVCLDVARVDGSAVAIGRWPNDCHVIAQRLLGRFTVMEPIECRDLLDWAERLEAATGPARAVVLVEFAALCMTQVSTALRSATAALRSNHYPALRASAANRPAVQALIAVASDPAMGPVLDAMSLIEATHDAVLHRRELWNEMKRAVSIYSRTQSSSLRDVAWNVRDSGRSGGRRVEHRTVSRTVLVKGLEFDHAIVLYADALGRPDLYVALTRGSRSLAVLSSSAVLRPGG